jgi:hypothetical protein
MTITRTGFVPALRLGSIAACPSAGIRGTRSGGRDRARREVIGFVACVKVHYGADNRSSRRRRAARRPARAADRRGLSESPCERRCTPCPHEVPAMEAHCCVGSSLVIARSVCKFCSRHGIFSLQSEIYSPTRTMDGIPSAGQTVMYVTLGRVGSSVRTSADNSVRRAESGCPRRNHQTGGDQCPGRKAAS